MSRTQSDEVVDQAIHGYSQGHQLLVASRELDNESENVLGHNSDSAPRARTADGSFITGYPLSSSEYVIARTWFDDAAERPNTVVTRSLIMPKPAPPGYSGERILRALRRPSPKELGGETIDSISVQALLGRDAGLSRSIAVEAAQFYSGQTRLLGRSGSERELMALAVWQQLWLPARFDLYFCTAPDTTRFSRLSNSVLFTGTPDGMERLGDRRVSFVVVDDLESPGPFREFLHFVGSGERDLTKISAFADAFELFTRPRVEVRELSDLLRRTEATAPTSLRRLKRRLLSFDVAKPRLEVDPLQLLESFAHDDVGRSVLASDASLDRWLREAWERDPELTTEILSNVEGDVSATGQALSAVEGLQEVIDSEASELITPRTLGLVARLRPALALSAVWRRNSQELWEAWGALGPRFEVPSGVADGGYEWKVALRGVRADSSALSRLLRRHPDALDSLIELADSEPAASDTDLNLSTEASNYLRWRLEGPDQFLIGLARLSSADALPRRLAVREWERLLAKSPDELVHATAYLVARRANRDHWKVAAQSVIELHGRLQGDGGRLAWHRLNPHLRGDRQSWDRCGRLLDDYAEQLRRFDEHTRSESLRFLENHAQPVAREFARRVRPRKAKKFSLLDPSTWI